MRKVRVLHLITHLGFGGAQDNTLLTVERLCRQHYEVDLAAGRDYTDWETRGREVADTFFNLPDLRRSPQPAADIRALRGITDLIRTHRYDIVHTHSAKAGTVGRLAARRAGVPVVIHTFHSFGWQAAHNFHGRSWQNHKSNLKKWIYVQIERYVASLSDGLITVCELNRREAIDLKLAPAEKLTTIYSGIDLTHFEVNGSRAEKCRSLGLDPSQPIVGTVGRLATQKAPFDFVQAARMTLGRRPDVQFIMVGDGPLTSEVQQVISNEPRIKILGYRDDVPEILSILDLFVQSSLWEGLGRAATEAMIMSVPVAATAVDGVPELVTHGKTGLLSPPGDPASLAENVVWLLDHPQEAQRMGRSGRERVVPEFGVEKMVDGIEALYEHLLAAKGYAHAPSR